MPNSIKKLSIWCPRPTKQAKYFIDYFTEINNIKAFSLSVIDIILVKPQNLELISKSDALLFVSQNAVNSLNKYNLDLNIIKNKTIIAIGSATKKALENINIKFSYTCKPPFNSETLISDPEFWRLNFKNIVIIKGEGGRNTIYDAIKSKGINISNLVCYKRKKILISTKSMVEFIDCNNINAVLVTSVDIAKQVDANLKQLKSYDYLQKNIVVFAFSKRIALASSKLGFTEIVTSKIASRDEFIKSIIKYLN